MTMRLVCTSSETLMHMLQENPEPVEAVDKTANLAGLSEEDAISGGWWSAKVSFMLLTDHIQTVAVPDTSTLRRDVCVYTHGEG